MMPDEMMQPAEVAAWVKVPEKTLAQWRYKGIGPAYYRVGKHVRYQRGDVEQWLDRLRAGAA